MKITGIGIDIIEINRFRTALQQSKEHFFKNTFSPIELDYCFSYKDPAPHLAGTFTAKEAIRKTFGKSSLPLQSFEIRRKKTGEPEVWVDGRKLSSLLVSITHSKLVASAIAFRNSS